MRKRRWVKIGPGVYRRRLGRGRWQVRLDLCKLCLAQGVPPTLGNLLAARHLIVRFLRGKFGADALPGESGGGEEN